jgi:hydroxymethylpyrimidine/phosphomethylpyrimidine kinase
MAGTLPQPIALTIAGSDSSGGAGIQADLKTFTALGVYGASVITALTAQNTHGVTAIHAIPGDMITAQLRAVATDLAINAVKTGMLGDRATVEVVTAGLREFRLAPLVVDPVMVATSGDVLLAPDAVSAVRRELIPLADLITPNLHEAAHLLDRPAAVSIADMEDQARRLLDLGAKAALVKGGHLEGGEAIDVLADASGVKHFASPRIASQNTHGTGCTLSAAIAAGLARGLDLHRAIAAAKEFVSRAILSGANLAIGTGNGPVDHLFALRDNQKSGA